METHQAGGGATSCSKLEAILEPRPSSPVFMLQEGNAAYSPGRSTPAQYNCSTPDSELEHTGPYKGTEAGQEGNWGTDNLLLAPLLPIQSVRLMPSGEASSFPGCVQGGNR